MTDMTDSNVEHLQEAPAPEPRMVKEIEVLVFGDAQVIVAKEQCQQEELLTMQHGKPVTKLVHLGTPIDVNDANAVAVTINRWAVEERAKAQRVRINAFLAAAENEDIGILAHTALLFGKAVAGTSDITPESYAYADIYVKAAGAVAGNGEH